MVLMITPGLPLLLPRAVHDFELKFYHWYTNASLKNSVGKGIPQAAWVCGGSAGENL